MTVTEQVLPAVRDSDLDVRIGDTAGTGTGARAGLVVDGLVLANR